jgi:hypothetical protein
MDWYRNLRIVLRQ